MAAVSTAPREPMEKLPRLHFPSASAFCIRAPDTTIPAPDSAVSFIQQVFIGGLQDTPTVNRTFQALPSQSFHFDGKEVKSHHFNGLR